MTEATTISPRRGSRWRRLLEPWRLSALLVALLILAPVIVVVLLALQPGDGYFSHMLGTILPRYTLTSLMLMAGVAVLVVLIGVSTAWLVTACDFPGRGIFEWALMLPLALPAYVIAIVYVELFDYVGPVQRFLRAGFGWTRPDDYWFFEIRSTGGAIVMMALVFYPYVYLLTRAAFIDRSIAALEVSRTLGHGPWRSFFSTALPLARPAIVVGTALALMEVLSDFGTVQIFAVHSFTAGIYDAWLGLNDRALAAQLASILLLFVLTLLTLERYSRRGRAYFGAGRRYQASPRVRLRRRAALLAFIVCALPVGMGFVLPALTLLNWTFIGLAGTAWQSFAADAVNSLLLAAAAAIVCVLVAILLAYAVRQSTSPWVGPIVSLASMGYAVPGAVIAVGVLIPLAALDNTIDGWMRSSFGTATGLLLSGTVVALIYAYTVRFLAIAYGGVSQSLGRVTPNIDAAARTLGKGPAATLAKVHIPIIRGGILSAALLVFVDVMKELPATLILRPFNFSTLATRIYEYASDELFEESAIWALFIVIVGIVPVIILSRAINKARPGQP